ncbi:MAG TPA: polymer-forming cytoskeletal protein [Gammaproteobacteria bacterium]|nr:polymer-forming cytoskeletal protein [Gammaproteobacteria bacterium]
MFRKQNDAPTANSFQIQASPEKRPAAPAKGVSVLGPTLSIKGGELSFDEDLIIEGTVEGKIAHQGHHLTIGKSGRVKANIRARLITVYGSVEGDLHGDDGVEISASARVTGNVVGPRVTLEGGATFKGSITTGDDLRAPVRSAPAAPPAQVDAGRAAQARAGMPEVEQRREQLPGPVADTPSFAMRGSAGAVTR